MHTLRNALNDRKRSKGLASVDDLIAGGRSVEAIDALESAIRTQRSPELEARLVQLRHDAFFEYQPSTDVAEWPPVVDDMFSDVAGIPDIAAADLTSAAVRSGIMNHGAIIVRNLLDDEQVERLAKAIRRSLKAYDAHENGAPVSETSPWYHPIKVKSDLPRFAPVHRQWVRGDGGCLAAESPRAMTDLIQTVRETGLDRIITDYLGERPALSVLKTTLRRVPPQKTPQGWHQDGAFLGEGIRTINVWMALTHCGIDAPSIDLVPRRLTEIVPTGTEGAMFDWSVSDSLASEVAGPEGIHHGVFAPGDIVLFDEMNLHRTSAGEEMTKNRLAIEAWFFAPSCFPLPQYPVLL